MKRLRGTGKPLLPLYRIMQAFDYSKMLCATAAAPSDILPDIAPIREEKNRFELVQSPVKGKRKENREGYPQSVTRCRSNRRRRDTRGCSDVKSNEWISMRM